MKAPRRWCEREWTGVLNICVCGGRQRGGVSPEWAGVKVLFLCLLMRGRETEREEDRPRESGKEKDGDREREKGDREAEEVQF